MDGRHFLIYMVQFVRSKWKGEGEMEWIIGGVLALLLLIGIGLLMQQNRTFERRKKEYRQPSQRMRRDPNSRAQRRTVSNEEGQDMGEVEEEL